MKTSIPYLRLLGVLLITVLISRFYEQIFTFLGQSSDPGLLLIFSLIAVLFVLSFSIFYLSAGTTLPSFVIAIFLGMAASPLLAPIVHNREALGALVSIGATFILFGGGLETPFKNFRKLIWKILSISFVGLFITAILLSTAIVFLNHFLGQNVSLLTAILLGSILASTDPAAIIPVLKGLRFKNRDTKDIVVSESAVTDVSGTLLTIVFLSLLAGGAAFSSVLQGYGSIFQTEALLVLFKQIFFGLLFGFAGYILLEVLKHFKEGHEKEFESDVAYFFFVPIVIYVLTTSLGGSGYLAAFIAGLMFMLQEHMHETEHFFNFTVDGFLKPVIFLLLGALVNFGHMFQYIGVGVLGALIFIFVIRPITVFISLGPFALMKRGLGIRELLFISFVRETGAIPAVLLITVVSMGIPHTEGLISIGMWVILITLILQPPLTPFVAKLLNVATDIKDEHDALLPDPDVTFVLLGSRGFSFTRRLPEVVKWATNHHIRDIVLLHCLEDKYSESLVAETSKTANDAFAKINAERKKEDLPPMHFWYVNHKGSLQRNINNFAKEYNNLTLIFVGRRVLDYRLADIKKLSVPLYFMD